MKVPDAVFGDDEGYCWEAIVVALRKDGALLHFDEDDKKHDAMQNMPSRPQSLHDYLYDQMSFLDASPLQLERMHFLITHLDEHGRLASTLEELAAAYNRVEPPPPIPAE